MSETDLELESSAEFRYFKAIEEFFLPLRGAGGYLSRSDYEVARGWFESGIPLEVVFSALEEVIHRRKQRADKDTYIGLRYGKRAVEKAWKELAELTQAGRRQEAPELDLPGALAAVAASLPASLPERESWQARILALEGDVAAVDQALQKLEDELLATLEATQSDEERSAFALESRAALARLEARLGAEGVGQAQALLLRRRLRERWGLSVLSLFSVG
jgi:hypothetical protein